MANITLKTVERVTTKSGTKLVFVTADDKDGFEQKMSAFDEAWNDRWKVGDTVSVEIRRNGSYLNLYPTAQEVDTPREAPKPAQPSSLTFEDTVKIMLARIEGKVDRIGQRFDARYAAEESNPF